MKTAALTTPIQVKPRVTPNSTPQRPIRLYGDKDQAIDDIPKALPQNERQILTEDNNSITKKLLLSGFDSLTRTLIRFVESYVIKPFFNDSEVARVTFRGVSELGRKYAESYVALEENKKLSSEDKITIWTRALENTVGSAIANPLNVNLNAFSRIGTGFANMTARLGTRIGLYGLNITNLDKVALQDSVGELVYRSLGRVLAFQSKNPLIVLGRLFGEQFAINSCLQFKPINHLFDTIKGFSNKDIEPNQEEAA